MDKPKYKKFRVVIELDGEAEGMTCEDIKNWWESSFECPGTLLEVQDITD